MRSLALAILLAAAPCVRAEGPAVSTSTGVLENVTTATRATSENVGPTTPNRVLPGEPPKRKNYLIPAVQIPLFQLALNVYDRQVYGKTEFGTTFAGGWRQVRRGRWEVDQDEFGVNQIGHPYQGSLYYGFARAAGLNFWEGWVYSNIGSAVWETFGENTTPSINDQVASGTAGPLIGESLYRMANLVLEGGEGTPGFWRELGAAFISPPTALDRRLFGEKYTPILKSRGAATFTQLQGGVGLNSKVRDPGSAGGIGRRGFGGDFSMAYGLPGKPGYLYLRPFDYFTFELSGVRQGAGSYFNIMTRGLLYGHKYELGDGCRGVWGLYGTYDYYSPQVFRFSTTAASFGSTFQWRLARKVALQGTALAGMGYGAAGTIVPQADEKDFHYGATPQGLLSLRLIFGARVMLDTTARAYHISGVGASRAPGSEDIGRFNASAFVRLWRGHAVGLSYVATTREAHYSSASLAARHQLVESVGLVYNLLGDPGFGVVHWGGE